MKLKLLEKGDKPVEWVKFELESNVGFANALRRAIIAHVPTLAIEDVSIVKNNSALYDEVLALRLGLVPIKADPELYWNNKDMKASFVLRVKGPGTVYSRDLHPSDPEIKPVFDTIPLVKLTEWQEVELEAVATVGTAEEHAKWQPGYAFYNQISENKFEFYVESFGNMSVYELIRRAYMVLEDMLEEFSEIIEKLPEGKKKTKTKTREKKQKKTTSKGRKTTKKKKQ